MDRAGEHLADLKDRIGRYAKTQKDNITVQMHGGAPHLVIAVEPPPRMFSVLVGEVIQNLRTGLDYLVYALAWLDSGAYQPKTQFPIESTCDGFKGRRSTYLKGVSDEHVAAIERLQPFNGGDWLGALADASNKDKHRALHLVVAQGSGTVDLRAPGHAGEGASLDGQMHVHHNPTLDVAFSDGTPVLKPLEILEASVRGVLDSFKPDFEG